ADRFLSGVCKGKGAMPSGLDPPLVDVGLANALASGPC
ncbi:hypothetical protein Tco_0642420, partial [Tanacetum coccineum]